MFVQQLLVPTQMGKQWTTEAYFSYLWFKTGPALPPRNVRQEVAHRKEVVLQDLGYAAYVSKYLYLLKKSYDSQYGQYLRIDCKSSKTLKCAKIVSFIKFLTLSIGTDIRQIRHHWIKHLTEGDSNSKYSFFFYFSYLLNIWKYNFAKCIIHSQPKLSKVCYSIIQKSATIVSLLSQKVKL